MELMKVSIPVFHDACPDYQTTSIIVFFSRIRVFSREEHVQVAVHMELRLIIEENPPPFILCSRQFVEDNEHSGRSVTSNSSHDNRFCSILMASLGLNKELLIQSQTRIRPDCSDHWIKQQYYIEVLRKLRERVGKKRSDLQSNNTWILPQDYAPVRNVLSVKQFL
ncbi:hypothetical protein TNCV_3903251 [Trichonephila clavipes]|nr:hypothetical protein TNCV_3903251 [Trichonephila clavipes]